MLIHELKIYSSQLAKQVAFYSSKLGIKCIHQTKEQASFQLGSSVLTIESRQNSTPYHFAITIPSNKEHEALNWLKERVKILAAQDIEIHDFNFWNAKAMYFYDSDQNIVEFIARKNFYMFGEERMPTSCANSILFLTCRNEGKSIHTHNDMSNTCTSARRNRECISCWFSLHSRDSFISRFHRS